MSNYRIILLAMVPLLLTAEVVVGVYSSLAQPVDQKWQNPPPPWGVSSSASAFRNHADWFPKMTDAGISMVRLFPEWQGLEPGKGRWNWDSADSLVKTAFKNNIEVTGILLGSSPGTGSVHAFPIEDLANWANYVSAVASRYKNQIRYWEVWNEGNGAFNDGRHTTSDYAKLAAISYAAAKKANPQAQVGITVASFDAPYLNQTILAMAKAGKPNSFDYICIHPYEIADGIANEVDGEIPFLWMSHLIRNILKDSAPERANAEVWITEVSRRIGNLNGHLVTEQDAAKALVKIYTMALAQGIAHVQWFEAQDAEEEEQGFGLLDRHGRARGSYQTLKALTATLGVKPAYQGWLALGRYGRGYGFVFDRSSAPVLIAWMPKGLTDRTISFDSDVKVIDSWSGVSTTLKAYQTLTLTDTPVFLFGLSSELVNQAKQNSGENFPWGGDYKNIKTVSIQPGSTDANSGIFIGRDGQWPVFKFDDGSSGIKVEGDGTHPVSFYVHPSFASIQTRDYYIRIAIRRLTAGNLGMNLFYEIADSQGKTPYVNQGQWFGALPGTGWQTLTWHVTGASFSKMWGYDFSIRPEHSDPFVLGKVEVSTEPFE